MVDVVGAQHRARELLQQVILLVGGVVGADDADGVAAVEIANFAEAAGDMADGFIPRYGREFALSADERLRQSVRMVGEVESVATLDAQEIPVDAALVAIVAAHDLHAGIATANSQGCLASVPAVGAHRAHVVHLPRTGLVPISAAGQRAHRADIDAHAAFFAIEMIAFIGSDHRAGAAVLYAQRRHVHALA